MAMSYDRLCAENRSENFHYDPLALYASHIAILCPRCSSMPRAVDPRLVEAVRLRRSGAEWDAAFEKAGVEDTSPA